MHTTKNLKVPANGWQCEGEVLQWVFGKLQGNDFVVYMFIVRCTVGYLQYTSDLISYEYIHKQTGVSLATVKRTMPKLIEQGFIIKLATNQVANVGKLPYKYQLNMKLPNFPGLGKLKQGREDATPTKQPWDERVQLYFTDAEDNILPLYKNNDMDSSRTKEWFEYQFSDDFTELTHPTTEQLLIYLKELT